MPRFFSRPRYRWISFLAVILFVVPMAAHAADANPVLNILGELLFTWLQALTWLVSKLIDVLILFAQYNTFYNHPIVLTGWNLVIQIANMMFLVALLVIAAGTVLNVQNYRYSRLLGNVILMALLVNFSRLIAGFFIQFSQVVMLTFVNSFKDALYGNFATMFGLDKVFQFATENPDVIKGASDIIIAMIVSMMFMVLAGGTIAAFVAIVVFRIVTLWVLLIMSPLAYALAILPQTKKYADEWWSEFTKNLVSGPVIAFYLWLALAIVAQYSVDNPAQGWLPGADARSASAINFSNQFLSLGNIVSFIVAMTFLSIGLKQATSASGAAGEWSKKLNGGVGGALGFVAGANLIRDRITRPVQGYWALRQKRNDEKVREQTMGLDAGMAAASVRTIGQLGRAKSGATAYAGALGRGTFTSVKNRIQGKAALGVGQIEEEAAQAMEAATELGSKGYQQQWKRVNDFNDAQNANRAKLEDLKKLTTEQLLGRASTMTGGAVLPYAAELANRRDARRLGKDQELEAIHARAGALGPDADKYREQLMELDSEMASKAFFGGVTDASGKLTEAFTKALQKDLSLTKLLTPAQLEIIKNDNGAFINYVHKISRNQKEFKTAVENINEDYRGDVTKNIDMTGQDLERRKMVGEVTGQWGQVFRNKTATGGSTFIPEFTQKDSAIAAYIKSSKKKFKESFSTAAAGDDEFIHALLQGKHLSEKDLDEIAEKSDYHKQALLTAFTGLDGDGKLVKTTDIYKRSQDVKNSAGARVGVVSDRSADGFGPQELARRMAFKLSGGTVISHTNLNGSSVDKNMVKNFQQMVKNSKASHVKKLQKNTQMKNVDFAKMVNETFGMYMPKNEVAELAALGPEEYAVADNFVSSLYRATAKYKKKPQDYLDMEDKAVKKIPDREERALAMKIRSYDADEKTKDLGS